ncbi:MAG TPA: ammonium transporter [Caulifigura sp.]|nr:ammonium transporter [Caulifigura sp.]
MRIRLIQRGLLTAMLMAFMCMTGFAQETATPAAETPAPAPAETAAPAAPAPLDTGNTAWILVSSALVLMMTAPGLAMFYGGLVRKKNVLGVFMQCMFLMGLMSVIWLLWGFSFAFSGENKYIGNFDMAMLKGVLPTWDAATKTHTVPMHGASGIPKLLFVMFQGMFFIITPALICGAFAERMKFSTMCVFCALWGTFIYCPVAHWVWSDFGWLFGGEFAAIDFAGGTVVHITSGVSALVCALVIGKRLGFGQEPMPPHNLTYTTLGAALLWVGWFGFNAGSALGANASAVNAFVSTHMAAATGLIAWSVAEWVTRGKPSVLGASSGAVAGLVCITPAAGSVDPVYALVLGLAGGFVCFFACTTIKNMFKYDDSLDAFGVHGVGGTLGAILSGVFATNAASGGLYSGAIEGNMTQLRNQVVGVGAAIAIAVVGTFILLKILDATMGLRVSQDDEIQGLDLSQHGEEGYIFH